MPDLDGIEVMRQLRERRPVAVILLTAKGSTADKAKGLDLGADDYIAKPFHPDELAARVRAVLRRSSGAQPGSGVLAFDDVEIDLERRMVTRDGELVQLSRTEWLLLQHLAANAGKVVLHTELLTKVWGPEYRDDLQYLRVWVSRVRRKLGAAAGRAGPDQDLPGDRLPARRRAAGRRPRRSRRSCRTSGRRSSGSRLAAGALRCRSMQRYGPGSALIVVDVQNDFADPDGSLSVAGGGDDHPADQPRDRVGRRPTAPSSWRPRTGTRRARPTSPRTAASGRSTASPTRGARRCHPDLALPDDAPRVRKGVNGEDGYSGFSIRDPLTGETAKTELDGLLRDAGVEHVVAVGLATDYCINATALDAIELGYRTDVLVDACAPVDLKQGDGERALAGLEAAGVGIVKTVMR